jgi:hypothetical protein
VPQLLFVDDLYLKAGHYSPPPVQVELLHVVEGVVALAASIVFQLKQIKLLLAALRVRALLSLCSVDTQTSDNVHRLGLCGRHRWGTQMRRFELVSLERVPGQWLLLPSWACWYLPI